jgi:hypothetical protein
VAEEDLGDALLPRGLGDEPGLAPALEVRGEALQPGQRQRGILGLLEGGARLAEDELVPLRDRLPLLPQDHLAIPEHHRGEEEEEGGADQHRRPVPAQEAQEVLGERVVVRPDDLTPLELLEILGELPGGGVAAGGLAIHGLLGDGDELAGGARLPLL